MKQTCYGVTCASIVPGILVCLLFSSLPLFFDDVKQIGDVGSEITGDQSEVNELTEAQKESLKASGLGRAASSTWSATVAPLMWMRFTKWFSMLLEM